MNYCINEQESMLLHQLLGIQSLSVVLAANNIIEWLKSLTTNNITLWLANQHTHHSAYKRYWLNSITSRLWRWLLSKFSKCQLSQTTFPLSVLHSTWWSAFMKECLLWVHTIFNFTILLSCTWCSPTFSAFLWTRGFRLRRTWQSLSYSDNHW